MTWSRSSNKSVDKKLGVLDSQHRTNGSESKVHPWHTFSTFTQ